MGLPVDDRTSGSTLTGPPAPLPERPSHPEPRLPQLPSVPPSRSLSPVQLSDLALSHRRVVRLNQVPAPVHRMLLVDTGEKLWIPESDLPAQPAGPVVRLIQDSPVG